MAIKAIKTTELLFRILSVGLLLSKSISKRITVTGLSITNQKDILEFHSSSPLFSPSSSCSLTSDILKSVTSSAISSPSANSSSSDGATVAGRFTFLLGFSSCAFFSVRFFVLGFASLSSLSKKRFSSSSSSDKSEGKSSSNSPSSSLSLDFLDPRIVFLITGIPASLSFYKILNGRY